MKNDMDELFTVSIEFFIFNDELWYRSEGKSPCRLKEQDYEFVTLIANLIEKFYPKAYIALASEYAKSKANLKILYVTLNLRATSRKPRRESWKDGIVESRKKK